MGNNRKAYRRLLERFVDSQQNFAATLEVALVAGDQQEAIRLAHTLKGVAGNLGAEDLQYWAGELETRLKADAGLQAASASHEQTLKALQEVLQYLQGWLTNQVCEDSSTEEAAPWSQDDLQVALEELAALLEDYDATAVQQVERLLERPLPEAWDKPVREIKALLAKYDFEAAQQLLDTPPN